jgi:hypothetical protein
MTERFSALIGTLLCLLNTQLVGKSICYTLRQVSGMKGKRAGRCYTSVLFLCCFVLPNLDLFRFAQFCFIELCAFDLNALVGILQYTLVPCME